MLGQNSYTKPNFHQGDGMTPLNSIHVIQKLCLRNIISVLLISLDISKEKKYK